MKKTIYYLFVITFVLFLGMDVLAQSPQTQKHIVFFNEKSDLELNQELKNRGLTVARNQLLIQEARRDLNEKQQSRVARIEELLNKKANRPDLQFSLAFVGAVFELTQDEVVLLQANDEVLDVVPDTPIKLALDESIPYLNLDAVWEYKDTNNQNITGGGVTIGILDSGVDYFHQDLGGCLGSGCKVIEAFDLADSGSPLDYLGHGTHVAAIAAGKGFLDGVAPDAKLVSFKVTQNDGKGSISNVLMGIERCGDLNNDGDPSDHLDVCNLSLTSAVPKGNPDSYVNAFIDVISENTGVVFVAAAGNNGPDQSTIYEPGNGRSVITVASVCRDSMVGTYSYCLNEAVATTSSRGPINWIDGNGVSQSLMKPDVAAPGVAICAARASQGNYSAYCRDTKHSVISGTSMAAPHVAGAVALLKQVKPGASSQEIKRSIKDTARPYDNIPEYAQGKGLIDVDAALRNIAPEVFGNTSSGETCREDIIINGKVDILDFLALSKDYHKAEPENPRANIDGEGLVDIRDFLLLSIKYGSSC